MVFSPQCFNPFCQKHSLIYGPEKSPWRIWRNAPEAVRYSLHSVQSKYSRAVSFYHALPAMHNRFPGHIHIPFSGRSRMPLFCPDGPPAMRPHCSEAAGYPYTGSAVSADHFRQHGFEYTGEIIKKFLDHLRWKYYYFIRCDSEIPVSCAYGGTTKA